MFWRREKLSGSKANRNNVNINNKQLINKKLLYSRKIICFYRDNFILLCKGFEDMFEVKKRVTNM